MASEKHVQNTQLSPPPGNVTLSLGISHGFQSNTVFYYLCFSALLSTVSNSETSFLFVSVAALHYRPTRFGAIKSGVDLPNEESRDLREVPSVCSEWDLLASLVGGECDMLASCSCSRTGSLELNVVLSLKVSQLIQEFLERRAAGWVTAVYQTQNNRL
ncbi:unnamed protein product [Linum trigynum]|uniref:Uncharacterized protein n=1 Tax=Linum trigynum TaxID=586398 RepID=A0AAV2FGM4_9ROSI